MYDYLRALDEQLLLAVEETLFLSRASLRSRVSPVSAPLELKMRQRHWERFCNALVATLQHFPILHKQRLDPDAERRALHGVIPYYEDTLELSLPPLYGIATLLAEIEGYRWVEEARERATSALCFTSSHANPHLPVRGSLDWNWNSAAPRAPPRARAWRGS